MPIKAPDCPGCEPACKTVAAMSFVPIAKAAMINKTSVKVNS
jgi:hypothetical protein